MNNGKEKYLSQKSSLKLSSFLDKYFNFIIVYFLVELILQQLEHVL